MRIGIYNRFLSTLGGGERYMLTIARLLGDLGEVDLLSQRDTPPDVIYDRLGIDVSDLGFVTLPDPSIAAVEEASEKYDLFINASHLDPVPSRAPASVLLVHFPSATSSSRWGRMGRKLGDAVLRPALSIPVLVRGFDTQEFSYGRRFWWTHGDGQLQVPSVAGRPPELAVPLASFRYDGTGPLVRFFSGDEEVGIADVPGGSDFHPFVVTPRVDADGLCRLSIRSDTFVPPAEFVNDPRQLGVAVGEVTATGRRGRAYRLLCRRLRPGLGDLLYGHAAGLTPPYVKTYRSIWTVSKFVKLWTRRYWDVDSSLINPPVDVEGIKAFGQLPKENLIVSVGRFFESNHNKKHLEMIAAFRRLLDEGLAGWELVLVGSVSDEPIHRDYLRRVQRAAEGLPVRIALDVPYDELLSLYARASIYWHATGYGVDERREPAAMEHFGITTVEAMAAGCVPIVIRKAGQKETVRHGRDGYLWRTLDELIEKTWRVIRTPHLRAALSESARQRSEAYSKASFERRLMQLADEALRKTPSPRA